MTFQDTDYQSLQSLLRTKYEQLVRLVGDALLSVLLLCAKILAVLIAKRVGVPIAV